MPVSVAMTEIINTVLGSTADGSRPAEAAIADLRTGMPALTYEQDPEIDMNEGSFVKTPATPIAGQDPEHYYNDDSVTVAETVRVSTLSSSSSESRLLDVRSNMPAITTRESEIDVVRAALIVISMKPLLSLLPKNVLKIMMTNN